MFVVMVEADGAGIASTSAEALTVATALAGESDVRAVVVGDPGQAGVDEALSSYGVQRRVRVSHAQLEGYSPELWGAALAQLIGQLRPDAMLAGGSDTAMELMAQAAARANLGYAANCTTITPGDDAWTVTRSRQGGLVVEDSELSGAIKLISLAQGAVEAVPAITRGGDVVVEEFAPELDGIRHSRLTERTSRGGGVTLSNARVVVSGGRGVGSAEGFAPLEELAGHVGGVVGCSRVATNQGWRSHSDQVGQTGTKINPDLYIACGISGATQHWVGCMGAKNILAINTDAEAPLVGRAGYAVIGDAGEVIAAVNDEILKRRADTGAAIA